MCLSCVWSCDSRSFADITVRPASADLNLPRCDRAAGFKSDDGESEAPFTLELQIFQIFCSVSHVFKVRPGPEEQKAATKRESEA